VELLSVPFVISNPWQFDRLTGRPAYENMYKY